MVIKSLLSATSTTPSKTSPEAPSRLPNKKDEVRHPKKSKAVVEVPVEPPKKRGRPSNAELAERAKTAYSTDNQLKDKLNAEIAERLALYSGSTVSDQETAISSIGFFYKNGQTVRWQTAMGEWETGHVIKHPVEMPDMVRVIYGNGYEEWKAAKSVKPVR